MTWKRPRYQLAVDQLASYRCCGIAADHTTVCHWQRCALSRPRQCCTLTAETAFAFPQLPLRVPTQCPWQTRGGPGVCGHVGDNVWVGSFLTRHRLVLHRQQPRVQILFFSGDNPLCTHMCVLARPLPYRFPHHTLTGLHFVSSRERFSIQRKIDRSYALRAQLACK